MTNGSLENTTVGVYLQEQVSWRNRLFPTGAIRADDNSAFGEDFELVTYPKVSASWVLSEEPFWPTAFVSTLKLRFAYGETGRQPSAFAALRTYSPVVRGDGIPAVTRVPSAIRTWGPNGAGESKPASRRSCWPAGSVWT